MTIESLAARGSVSADAARAKAGAALRALKPAFEQKLVYLVWVVMVMDPQWFAASLSSEAVLKIPSAFYIILGACILAKPPGKEWYLPFALFVASIGVMVPFATLPREALTPAKGMVIYYVVALGASTFIRSPRESLLLVWTLFFVQFLWWLAHGLAAGAVAWHPNLANFDAYGPLMTIGIGLCYFFAKAHPKKTVKLVAYLTALLCVGGVVSSFARGAEITAGLVLLWIWARSPNKGRNALMVIAAAVTVAIAGSMLSKVARGGNSGSPVGFFADMATIMDASNDETGNDRKALWGAAVKIWMKHPLFGVGAESVGAAAAQSFDVGELGGAYADNPGRMWNRDLHSSYFQILSEMGIVGVGLFGWLLVDFFRRNRDLRKPLMLQAWQDGGGRLDLRYLSLGLEVGMVAYLGTGFFYNQLWTNWMWTLLALNLTLHGVTNRALHATSAARVPAV